MATRGRAVLREDQNPGKHILQQHIKVIPALPSSNGEPCSKGLSHSEPQFPLLQNEDKEGFSFVGLCVNEMIECLWSTWNSASQSKSLINISSYFHCPPHHVSAMLRTRGGLGDVNITCVLLEYSLIRGGGGARRRHLTLKILE